MKYFSTRGGDQHLSFEETVLTGLAPNGGLYIPSQIPALPKDWQTSWANYSFQDLSHAILSLFVPITEISSAELRSLIERSYSTFRHPDVTPVRKLRDREFVLELWHGPTFAFKDVALQLLGNLFEFFLKRRNKGKAGSSHETLTVVGATSGDTGSAAIYGLRGKSDISIFILHPKNRVSPIQEAQMTTVTDSNVHNIAVKGTFDDCQDIVKALFADKAFNDKYHLGAVNSINWARILAQIVYYFLAYFQATRLIGAGARLQFVVPTGNFGDVLAGWYAKRMGLPMEKLVVATNSNDILTRFWATGRYEKSASFELQPLDGRHSLTESVSGDPESKSASGVKETLSPAMDILVSSNFERLLWYLAHESLSDVSETERSENASKMVRGWMDNLKNNGRAAVPARVLELARKEFSAERVDDDEILETIRLYYEARDGFVNESYISDPHTAVGLAAARRTALQNSPGVHQVILSTAHPAKFSEAVTKALSSNPSLDFDQDVLPSQFKGLLEKERRVIDVEEPSVEKVRVVISRTLGYGVGK
ncbi:threonine synthase [Cantharellus anzutake]|uniref:threonine synthase n=1 Tax=Cantharellus anzutake TaxID=1750568 RepID=UPI001903DFB5|nr:threonine synthase [Cantharellus anzutake]KAF8311930.1 threonine synthase [Cantharellus anzutake]